MTGDTYAAATCTESGGGASGITGATNDAATCKGMTGDTYAAATCTESGGGASGITGATDNAATCTGVTGNTYAAATCTESGGGASSITGATNDAATCTGDNGNTFVAAACSNSGVLNTAGDGCETPAFTAAVDASCSNSGTVNANSNGCKTPVFTAADHTCIASDFGDKTKACCKAKAATPSAADDHDAHDHAPSPATVDAASSMSPASLVTVATMLIAYMMH